MMGLLWISNSRQIPLPGTRPTLQRSESQTRVRQSIVYSNKNVKIAASQCWF